MASINLGKVAFQWRSVYSAEATYNLQDVVSYNGDSWVCTLDGTTGIAPSASPWWSLFAQGTQGVSSSAGEVIYSDGNGLVALPAGQAGEVLQIDKTTLLPVWGPADVRSSTRAKALPASVTEKHAQVLSYRHFAVIMNDDSLRMWGYNGNYNLGDGTTYARSYPVRPGFPPGFPGVAKVYQMYNSATYVIDLDGKLWSWGYNGYGVLGTGDTNTRFIPYCASDNALNSINGKVVTQVAIPCGSEGYNTVMVLCDDGTVHTCGYNGYGQLGQGDTNQRNNFQLVPALNNIVDICLGRERYTSAFAVTASGQLYSWGYNGDYALGSGNNTQSNLAMLRTLGSLSGKVITKVFTGYISTYALDDEGNLHSCGGNNYGQLGNGNTGTQSTFVQVATDVVDVYAGGYDYPIVFIKKSDGTLWGCGYGGYGGNGEPVGNSVSSFFQLDFGQPVQKMIHSGTGSYNWGAALLADGTVQAWGYNGNGVLMTGSTDTRYFPSRMVVPTGNATVVDIACWNQSSEQSIAFMCADGQLLVGGYAGGSSLPEDDSENSYAPMPVPF